MITRLFLVASAAVAIGISAIGPASAFEFNTDRPGNDFANFDLPSEHPSICRDACDRDTRCKAWSYVKPGIQGPRPRCWLKHSESPPLSNNCCISDVGRVREVELNTDRPGNDIRNFDLPAPDPNLCRGECLMDQKCVAYTYVKPGIQGPNARCWLKNPTPPAFENTCCISGGKLPVIH
jgi:hypothetical protein